MSRKNQRPGYKCWQMMNNRCRNPRATQFKRYGGRGITVCLRWQGSGGFENFIADVGERPTPAHEIDRFPDRDGNYQPGNVRWATRKQQMRNTTANTRITWRGETRILVEWAEHLGLSYKALHLRLTRLKWPVERAFTEPIAPGPWSKHKKGGRDELATVPDPVP